MKFLIQKREIYESIKVCNSIIDNTISTPYIQGLYMCAKNDKLTLITTNGFISSKSEITNVKIIEEGSVLIKSKLINSIIQKLKYEEIFFEKIDNSVIKIKTESFDSNINIMDDEQYPNINFDTDNWKEIDIPSTIFKDTMNKVIHSVSQSKDKNSILSGVCFESKEGVLSIVGTDSFKLSYLSYKFDGPEFKIVLDYSLFNFLSEIVNNYDVIKMYLLNNNVVIKIGKFYFSSKLMDGEYPDVSNIIKSPKDNFSIVDKKSLIEGLERGVILAMVEKKPIVKIDFKENNITLNFKSIELGSSQEIIKIQGFHGNEMSFLLNTTYLISLLKVIDNEIIKISNFKENKPIFITDDKNSNFIQLLLPLRNV